MGVFTYEVLLRTPWKSCAIKPQFPKVSARSKFVSRRLCVRLRSRFIPGRNERDARTRTMAGSDELVPIYQCSGVIVGALQVSRAGGQATEADINLNFPNDFGNALSMRPPSVLLLRLFCNVALCSRFEIMLGVDPTDYFSKNHSLFKVNAFTFRLIFRTSFLMTQTLWRPFF